MSSKRFYVFVSVGLLIGYLWIGFQFYQANKIVNNETLHYNCFVQHNTCIIKATTGYPCPACGSSRAVISLAQGNVQKAILYNPFGVFMGLLMLVLPFWMLIDYIRKNKSLFRAFGKMEGKFKNKWVMTIFVLLVLANWIWNIYKGI